MKEKKSFNSESAPEFSSSAARILCVDRKPALRACYAAALSHSGYDITTVGNNREAWAALQSGDFDLVITDNETPDLNGAELVSRMRAGGMDQPVIIAASRSETFIEPYNRWLLVTVLQKPFRVQELTDAVGRILCGAHHIGWGEALVEEEHESNSFPLQQTPAHSFSGGEPLPAGAGHFAWGINE
jgi:DNA-binding response OmpR family regulator